MKVVKYVALAALVCTSQISLSIPDYIDYLIQKNVTWLEEQLTQLSYWDLTQKQIEQLSAYFVVKTYAFCDQLFQQSGYVDQDRFQESMSIAMHRIVNATIQCKAKVRSGELDDITVTQIMAIMIDQFGGQLYDNILNRPPQTDPGNETHFSMEKYFSSDENAEINQ